MPRFFKDEINEDNLCLTGADAHHVGFSLRMKPGEQLTLCCGGIDYDCEISSITGDCVYLDLIEKHPCMAEPDINVTLFQAVPKLDKLEFIIQKSVELGVSRIVPVLTRRCISRPDSRDFEKKLKRLTKIAEEAAKQSGRGIIPEVTPIVSYKKALEMMSSLDKTIMFYEAEGGKPFGEVDFSGAKNIGLVIGSEGGFDADEVRMAVDAGTERVWLGKRILRCETAPITGLSILMFLTNNM
ncbi:MAG: 16S rRNA (uracil(1498)-N(3))-methyltransferase [Ruminococcus sp.]|nr:16S rRNA (uracil(1498)-N(3))-methyltransferase [Ruminococcus sp.]